MSRNLKSELEERGFAIVRGAVSKQVIEELRAEADRLLQDSSSRGGARNLLHRSDRLTRVGERGVPYEVARTLLGDSARPIKLTLFNKTPSANWSIRWHQDLNITVKKKIDMRGFSSWSLKEGIIHVRPPVAVLQKVVAVRLHLDETPAENGALRVIPGSHRLGRLDREAIRRCREKVSEVTCEVPLGGIMIMSPLLLHASSKSTSPENRRVLHFELSGESLPGGLEWA